MPPTSAAETGAPEQNQKEYSGHHHARYLESGMLYHAICRIFQGRCLLRPCKELNDIILGVIGQGLKNYPSIKLYNYAFLSNHVHAMISGEPEQLCRFMGYIKREISRRWGKVINWPGTMWDDTEYTALPTLKSQERCFKYILSQGPKENLVETSEQWPGVHGVHALLQVKHLVATWFNGTNYGLAVRAEQRKKPKNQKMVRRCDYEERVIVKCHLLPSWKGFSPKERINKVKQLSAEVALTAALKRNGNNVLGAEIVQQMPLELRIELPPQPWFEKRRKMICWAEKNAEETCAYLQRYWGFQRNFREASKRWLSGDLNAEFPPGAFRPVTYIPIQPAV